MSDATSQVPSGNPPGAPAIARRAGTYATFMADMRTALATTVVKDDQGKSDRPFDAFTNRSAGDPTMALLDAWACTADVLTFYQERLANEGYLRTARHRRSLVEQARLVGYVPRPGVAATAYLAFTVEDGAALTLPAGSAVQSVPAPDDASQMMQTFETTADCPVSADWNAMRPQLTVPLVPPKPADGSDLTPEQSLTSLTVAGMTNNLKAGDLILVAWPPPASKPSGHTSDAESEKPPPDYVPYQISGVAFQKRDGLLVDRTVLRLALLQQNTFPKREPESQTKQRRTWSGALSSRLSAILDGAPDWAKPRRRRPPRDADRLNDGRIVLRSTPTPTPTSTSTPTQTGVTDSQASQLRLSLEALRQSATSTPDIRLDLTSAFATTPVATPAPTPNPTPAMTADALSVERAAAKTTVPFRMTARKAATPTPLTPAAPAAITEAQAQLVEAITSVSSRNLDAVLPTLTATAAAAASPAAAVYALRVQAAPFGKDAPPQTTAVKGKPVNYDEWSEQQFHDAVGTDATLLPLNKVYPTVAVGNPVMIVLPNVSANNASSPAPLVPAQTAASPLDGGVAAEVRFATVLGIAERLSTGLGPAVNTTVLMLDKPWHADDFKYALVRHITVWVGTDPLDAAAQPDTSPVSLDPPPPPPQQQQQQQQQQSAAAASNVSSGSPPGAPIQLDGIYRSLSQGQTLIVTGDLTTGGASTDVVSLVKAQHQIDPPRTRIWVSRTTTRPAEPAKAADPAKAAASANPAAQTSSGSPAANGGRAYLRDTVTILGNVVTATHGETRIEVLGSGTAQPLQRFALRASPLTFVPADNPSGAASTLQVFVNDVRWHEVADGISDAGPHDRVYVVRTDPADDGTTTTSVLFGDGVRGACPPTGRENVRATYRAGIGTAGNVAAGRISQLRSRPHGLKGVVNPAAATGATDPEPAGAVRRNAPVVARALGRAVSVDDYADFARTFAGVTKAAAIRTVAPGTAGVQVVVAGAGEDPLPADAPLLGRLRSNLVRFGVGSVAVTVVPHVRRIVFLQLSVTTYADFDWPPVRDAITAALLADFGFDAQDLGQPIYESDVAAAVQGVPGVAYVKVEKFTSLAGTTPPSLEKLADWINAALNATPAVGRHRIDAAPDEVACLSADLPQSLVVNQASSTSEVA